VNLSFTNIESISQAWRWYSSMYLPDDTPFNERVKHRQSFYSGSTIALWLLLGEEANNLSSQELMQRHKKVTAEIAEFINGMP